MTAGPRGWAILARTFAPRNAGLRSSDAGNLAGARLGLGACLTFANG